MRIGSLLAIGALLSAVSLCVFSCASAPPPQTTLAATGVSPPGIAPPLGEGVTKAVKSHGLFDLMPYPASIVQTGGDLRLREMPIVVENGVPAVDGGGHPGSPRVDFAVSLLRRRFDALTGRSGTSQPRLVLNWNRTARLSLNEQESYSLVVNGESIAIDAPTDLGILHGIATLSQLLREERGGEVRIPRVVIHDHPRFRWRGLMLDCVRHFMPVATIKRTLLGMAAVKLNVFHWHLSDDQGFRLQSKAFPLLTEVGSNGRYYTQEQVREIVHYADLLGIRVVPELDMPAHTSAILAAYPSLGAGKGPYHVQTDFGGFNDVMDPTLPSTYHFVRLLLTEMVKLFPDRYMHIGGDENNYREWAGNPGIRAFMRAHHMTSYPELSRYFTGRVEEILASLHRRAVFWEESWNGLRDPGSVVQVWAEPDLIRKAVSVGQSVIRSQRYYLDLLYPASYHYAVDPADGTGNDTTVLGGEAAMWTELVSPANLDSRLWPRLAAIAERFWSPESIQSVQAMYARLPAVDNYLASIGMRQYVDERSMLTHLAGGHFSAALKTLASVLQPLEGYGRISSEHYTTKTRLDRMVDAIPPESVAAREFADITRAILTGVPLRPWQASARADRPAEVPAAITADSQVRRAALREARAMLELWLRNNARLQGLLAERKDLQELVGVSANLTLVAGAGLSALDRLERSPPGLRPADDPAWLERERAILRNARVWNSAQVDIAVEEPVLRLVFAACGFEPPKRR